MKNFVIFILFFISINLSAFYSEKQDAYETLIYYNKLTNNKNIFYFPVSINDSVNSIDNVFVNYLKNKIQLQNINNKNNILFNSNFSIVYDSSFNYYFSLYPKVKIELDNNIDLEVSAFIKNDTVNKDGYTVHVQDIRGQNIIAGFNRGDVSYKKDNFFLILGRLNYMYSFNNYSSLIHDYNAPPMDGIILGGQLFDKLDYIFKFSSLKYMQVDSQYISYRFINDHDIISRFLSMHSFCYSPYEFLHFSLSESVVFGREDFTGFDYIFPFFVFYGEQDNININDNILWQFDINYNYLNILDFSFSLLIDDYQYEHSSSGDNEPPMLGYELSIYHPLSHGYIGILHHFVNAWVYNQMFPWNRYTFNDNNIGYSLAPDIRDLIITSYFAINRNMGLKYLLGYYVKGNNSTNNNWVFPVASNSIYLDNYIGIAPIDRYVNSELSMDYSYSVFNFSIRNSIYYDLSNKRFYNSIILNTKIYL